MVDGSIGRFMGAIKRVITPPRSLKLCAFLSFCMESYVIYAKDTNYLENLMPLLLPAYLSLLPLDTRKNYATTSNCTNFEYGIHYFAQTNNLFNIYAVEWVLTYYPGQAINRQKWLTVAILVYHSTHAQNINFTYVY